MRAAVERAASALEAARRDGRPGVGAVERVYGLSAYYLIAPAEASSNLARYDGVRYGLRVDGDDVADDERGARATPASAREVKRRIMLGTYALSAGYYDAYYGQAQRVRTLIIRDFDRAYEQFDVLLSPTSPTVAFELGAKTADPLAMYLQRRVHDPDEPGRSRGDHRAVRHRRGGLPIGVQVLAAALGEPVMFRVARAIEAAGAVIALVASGRQNAAVIWLKVSAASHCRKWPAFGTNERADALDARDRPSSTGTTAAPRGPRGRRARGVGIGVRSNRLRHVLHRALARRVCSYTPQLARSLAASRVRLGQERDVLGGERVRACPRGDGRTSAATQRCRRSGVSSSARSTSGSVAWRMK